MCLQKSRSAPEPQAEPRACGKAGVKAKLWHRQLSAELAYETLPAAQCPLASTTHRMGPHQHLLLGSSLYQYLTLRLSF